MPLSKGPGTIRANVKELMQPVKSRTRKKAISTIARKHGISPADAQYRQSIAIAKAQARKR